MHQKCDTKGATVVFDREPLQRIQFEHNPLRVVVAQLRFPTEFRLSEAAILARIQDRLRDRYPVAQATQQQMSIQLAVGPTPPQLMNQMGPGPIRFIGDDGAWIVTLGPDVLSLETTDYHDWVAFLARFEAVLDAVHTDVAPPLIQRLGLRFIDELQHPEARTLADWSRFLDPELLGTAASARFAQLTTTTSEQITIVQDEDAATITHAYTQNGRDADPPSTYLIDLDCFSTRPFALDRNALRAKLVRYHGAAWNMFRESLLDPMVEALGRAE